MRPETHYARSGDLSIAYQVVGDGPLDLVVVPGWISNLDFAWEDPLHGEWVGGLAAFSRVILFDKRGTGPCIFGGALVGMAVQNRLPPDQRSPASQDAIKMSAGVISLMAASSWSWRRHRAGGDGASTSIPATFFRVTVSP